MTKMGSGGPLGQVALMDDLAATVPSDSSYLADCKLSNNHTFNFPTLVPVGGNTCFADGSGRWIPASERSVSGGAGYLIPAAYGFCWSYNPTQTPVFFRLYCPDKSIIGDPGKATMMW